MNCQPHANAVVATVPFRSALDWCCGRLTLGMCSLGAALRSTLMILAQPVEQQAVVATVIRAAVSLQRRPEHSLPCSQSWISSSRT